MTRSPGWQYFYSEVLKMEYAVRVVSSGIDTGKAELYTEDKMHYSPSELAEIRRPGKDGKPGEITLELHMIKKAFSVGKDFARVVVTP